ncbi:MAG: glycosyltransferase family 1 protein [Patescibacteria group bacterium]
MKIGVDIRVLMDKNYSGISEYTANLLSEILKQDRENKYKLFYNSSKGHEARLDYWAKDNSKLFATSYPNKIFNYFLQRICSRPKLDKILGGTDIFFAPHFNFLNVSHKTKLIVTVHDLSFLRYPEFFSKRKNFWHKALRIKKLLNRADRIVAVSENTKHDLMELLSIPAEKIKVIYSGNNCQEIITPQEKITDFLEKKNLKNGFILSVGNIEPRKNISGLISAYNKLRNKYPEIKNQLVLAGAKGWKYKKVFSDWAKSPYKEDIKFLGYISIQEKEMLYSSAAVFVYPSFYEGFGFPPLEAMVFGLPVVSSNVSSLPEVLGKAALLINPFKPEDIAEAIKLILTDANIRTDLIEAGKVRAAMFTWEKASQEYLKLFSEINEENK